MNRQKTFADLILANRLLRNADGDDPGSGDASLDAEIEKYNQGIDAGEDQDIETDQNKDTEEGKETETGVDTEDKSDTEEEEEEDKEESGEEEEEEEPAGEESEFKFTEGADYETFLEETEQYLETVNITPELQTILDRQRTEVESARSALSSIEAVGKPETVVAFMSAVNEMFETEMVEGVPMPKTKAFVDHLRTNFRNEFAPLAVEILAAPSLKIRGATMFEEALMDQYDAKPEQIKAITKYLLEGEELPVPPPGVRLPASVHEQLKDAWYKTPEVKRFEIDGLTKEVQDLKKELDDPETSPYDREEIKQRLGEKAEKLKIEIDALADRQSRIEGERRATELREQHDREAVEEFVGKVVTEYNTNLFTLSDNAAKSLAPRLTYLDADAQLAEARDKLARVTNALSFRYDAEGNVEPDPLAEHWAAQLKEEGIDYDFAKGRQLLQDQFQAIWKLQHLKETNGSKMAIERAEDQLRRIDRDIKEETQQVLGLIAAKRVKSSGQALEKKVSAIKEKKQAAVPRITGQPSFNRRKAMSTAEESKDINAEIKRYNRQIEEQDSYIDDEILFGRKAPPKAPAKAKPAAVTRK